MARIILAWELGSNLGHINKLSSLAKEFTEQGHEVLFVLKDLSRAQSFLGEQGYKLLQAPIWLPPALGMPPVESYVDILMRKGYLSSDGVIGLVKGWLNIFDLFKADLVVADHAPTALLSARIRKIPTVTFGNSFALPPSTEPLPNLLWWNKSDRNKSLQREKQVLNTINDVCKFFNAPALERLADLFDVDANYILSLPELDCYRGRVAGEYYGPAFNLDVGATPVWQDIHDKKIFAYLYPGYKGFESILQALNSLPCSSVVYAPGTSQQIISKYESDQLVFSSLALKIRSVREECDLGICHSGGGTGAGILLAGKPLLLLPTQQEQLLSALRIEELGAAIVVRNQNAKINYKKQLKDLLNDEKYMNKAREFANQYSDLNIDEKTKQIAEQCVTFACG